MCSLIPKSWNFIAELSSSYVCYGPSWLKPRPRSVVILSDVLVLPQLRSFFCLSAWHLITLLPAFSTSALYLHHSSVLVLWIDDPVIAYPLTLPECTFCLESLWDERFRFGMLIFKYHQFGSMIERLKGTYASRGSPSNQWAVKLSSRRHGLAVMWKTGRPSRDLHWRSRTDGLGTTML